MTGKKGMAAPPRNFALQILFASEVVMMMMMMIQDNVQNLSSGIFREEFEK
jgi:hypothetical protein